MGVSCVWLVREIETKYIQSIIIIIIIIEGFTGCDLKVTKDRE